MALAPLPGSSPACAATPWTISSNSPHPLRAVFAAPPGSAGSMHQHRAAAPGSSSIRRREVPLPTSSSDRPEHDDPRRCRWRDGAQRADRQQRDGQAGLHVEDARAVEPAVRLAERHPLELADIPDGVEVAEHAGPSGPAPPTSARRWSPRSWIGDGRDAGADRRARVAAISRRSDRPARLSRLGDSSRTNVSRRSRSHADSRSHQRRRADRSVMCGARARAPAS